MAIENQNLAYQQDNRIEHNILSKSFYEAEARETPSSSINFSNMSHKLVWRSQTGEYDNLMKNSYFSLSDAAIEKSRKENEFVTPQDILRDMKRVGGERNVPHYLNYPSDDNQGTISNAMIKERNFQKYMQNPSYIREMIADAFLLKIANDGSISEMDRKELLQEAENGKDSAELHDMIARMTYKNPTAYQSFHKILLESEKLHREVKSGDEYGYVSEKYNEHYTNMALGILQSKEDCKSLDIVRRDNEIYIKQDGIEQAVSDVVSGQDINAVSELILFIEKAKERLLEEKYQKALLKEEIDISNVRNLQHLSSGFDQFKDDSEIKPYIERLEEFSELMGFSLNVDIDDLKKTQQQIEDTYNFSKTHDINQNASNKILYEMHQSGRYDQNPFVFLDMPRVGDEKEDGSQYTAKEVRDEIEYNAVLIRGAIHKVLGDEVKESTKDKISSNIVKDLYSDGKNGEKGAYFDAVQSFVEKSRNDPMTMTVYSDLNSVATTIMRDVIYNELMEQSLQEKDNAIYEQLRSTGQNRDIGKTVHIAEKIRTGAYIESLEKQEKTKDRVASLMNKATLFSKVAKGEINSEQKDAIIDDTAIFGDMSNEEKEAIKIVTDDIFKAKDEMNMAEHYDIDNQSNNRFLDDIVTDNVFSHIENRNGSGFMPGISKFFRNNRAMNNFVRCGQSGSIKDRNAESVANNLKGCMENYREAVERGRDANEELAVNTLRTVVGSTNGIVVALIMMQQFFMDQEYRNTRRALNEMHNDILNKLAFRRASPDIKTEKARAATLSAEANRGVTNTTIAHEVADKYRDTLRQEKIAGTVYNASMNGENLFNKDQIAYIEPMKKQSNQIDLQVNLNDLTKSKERIESQLKLLKKDTEIIRKASLIDEVELDKIAEETYGEFDRISKLLNVTPDASQKQKLEIERGQLANSMQSIREQHEIIEAAIKMKSAGIDPLESTQKLKESLLKIEAELEAKTKEMELYSKSKEEMINIKGNSFEELTAKSEYLRKIGEKIAIQNVDNLSKKHIKTLEEITKSREILAAAMIKKSGYIGAIESINQAIVEQFGRNRTIKNSLNSGYDKLINSLDIDAYKSDILRISKSTNKEFNKIEYIDLLLRIEKAHGDELRDLLEKQKNHLQETHEKLNKKVTELKKNLADAKGVDAPEHSIDKLQKEISAREKDISIIREYTIVSVMAREASEINDALESKANGLVSKLQSSTPLEAVQFIDKEKYDLLAMNKESHAMLMKNTKEKLEAINMEFSFSDGSDELKFLNNKSQLASEAKDTVFDKKIENALGTIIEVSELSTAKVGDTHNSLSLSNRTNGILKNVSGEKKESIFQSAGIAIREFINKTNDNMSSMLLFTESRAIYMESAKEELLKNGNTIEAAKLDNQLKEYVAENMDYSIDGIEAWGINAKSGQEIRKSGASIQEGQRQTRAAML